MANIFEIKDDFYLNGKRIKIISGGIHYFRILPEYWEDRLLKLKAMGCNTVETYVPWNLHEKEKGEFDFSGILDIKKFLTIAHELGLMAIVRPSPYICAEWEFGGLPYWLLKEDTMHLRADYEPFLKHVDEYYNKLFDILVPLQITNGGPIIIMQLENEYGYYGDDTNYLYKLKQMMVNHGAVVPFVTSDGPWGDALECGKIEGVLQTGNFGSKAKEQFEILKQHIGNKPLMCMEFWVGWFDNWGVETHQTSDLQQNIKDLDEILSQGNVNIYMFEGGTNFGFMNGSNYYDILTADVTSYDYDAVLTEDGSITPKYEEFKKVISKYTEIPQINFNTQPNRINYGTLTVSKKTGLFANLNQISTPIQTLYPTCMEKLGQGYGYTLYRSKLTKESEIEKIRLWDANDRVNIFVDTQPIITLYDRELLNEHEISIKDCNNKNLNILTENMGRVNFGPTLEKQRKGINGTVQINGHQHLNWTQYCLPMDNLDKLDFSLDYNENLPAFFEFKFDAHQLGDTYLDFSGWGKGCILVNGFNIGRFWEIGPQKRLYIPAPLLKIGENTILIFETEGKRTDTITLCNKPDIGANNVL